MQKSRIKRQSNYIRSGTVNLGHQVIKRPLIQSIYKSKTQNWGNSRLLGRTVVTVFNVPFPYIYHFSNFYKDLWNRALGRPPLNSLNLSLCPFIWNSHLFYIAKFLLFLMAILEANFFSKYKTFSHLLKSVNNKHTLFELMSRRNIHQHTPRERLHPGRET